MFSQFIDWVTGKKSARRSAKEHAYRVNDAIRHAPPAGHARPQPDDEQSLIRNKFVREDTGTHETLKILDDSIIDSGEEEGFDPYNTGDFDRSKNWERRWRDW
jgi:hypothetical protein